MLIAMPDIAEPLRPVRVLATPQKFLPLRNFSCGRKGKSWETMVNSCVRGLYLGIETSIQTVVVLEDASGTLIGVGSFLPHSIPYGPGRFSGNAQRIHILGTDRLYHGKRLIDGSRPGDVLLAGALAQIESACGARMPHVSALVSPENHRSRDLFARHGFRELPYAGEGEVIYVRVPRKQLPAVARRSPAMVRKIIRMVVKDQVVEDSDAEEEMISA